MLFVDNTWGNKQQQHNDYAHSSNKSDKIIENAAKILWQIVKIAEDLEMGGEAKKVDDM